MKKKNDNNVNCTFIDEICNLYNLHERNFTKKPKREYALKTISKQQKNFKKSIL